MVIVHELKSKCFVTGIFLLHFLAKCNFYRILVDKIHYFQGEEEGVKLIYNLNMLIRANSLIINVKIRILQFVILQLVKYFY